MMIEAVVLLAAGAASQGTFDPDAAIIPPGHTCSAIWEAERSIGSKGAYEGPYDPNRGLVFYRKYNRDDAAIIYLCNGNELAHRLINMRFPMEQDAIFAFDRHRAILIRQFGNPCWDPDALSTEQKARLPNGDLSTLGWFRNRVEWNASSELVVSLTRSQLRATPVAWQVSVAVNALDSSVPMDSKGVVGELYGMSSCAKGR